eukprot:scaffold6063_cov30-Phaeocystis_antarctica.AAC.1
MCIALSWRSLSANSISTGQPSPAEPRRNRKESALALGGDIYIYIYVCVCVCSLAWVKGCTRGKHSSLGIAGRGTIAPHEHVVGRRCQGAI